MTPVTPNHVTEEVDVDPQVSGSQLSDELAASPSRSGRSRWWLVILLAIIIVVSMALIFGPFTKETIGGGCLLLMLVLIFLRVPVAVVLSGVGILGLYSLFGSEAAKNMFGALPYEETAKWQLSVIPMFVFMSMLLGKSGVNERAYDASRQWLSWLPGGLGIGTNAAGAGLAAVSGSTVATSYALTRMAVPEMLKAGYDRRLAVAAVMTAGLSGQLIPPSLFLVIYAGIAQVPVGQQLMAGVGPGLLVAITYSFAFWLICVLRPSLEGDGRSAARSTSSWEGRWRTLVRSWPLPVIIGLVIGGIYTGWVTATEAGALGALASVLLTLTLGGRGRLAKIYHAAIETSVAVGAIFLLLIGAHILTRLMAVTGLATGFAEWVVELNLGRLSVIALLFVAYLILGMFLDPLAIMLLTVPLLLPTMDAIDVSPLWFGVFVVFMAELAVITPPVGILSFIVHQMLQEPEVNQGKKVSLGDVFTAVAWFLPVALPIAALLVLVPEIATFLPGRM